MQEKGILAHELKRLISVDPCGVWELVGLKQWCQRFYVRPKGALTKFLACSKRLSSIPAKIGSSEHNQGL